MTLVLVTGVEGKELLLSYDRYTDVGIDIIVVPVARVEVNRREVEWLRELLGSCLYDYTIIMSSTVVSLLKELGLLHQVAARSKRMLCVGPKTRASIERELKIDVETPRTFSSDGVLEHIRRLAVRGQRALVIRSEHGDNVIARGLSDLCIEVHEVRAYGLRPGEGVDLFYELLLDADFVIITSSRILEILYERLGAQLLERLTRRNVVALGSKTSRALSRLGVRHLVPDTYTMEGALDVIMREVAATH